MRKIEYDATRARPWKRPKLMFRGRKKSIWNKKLNVNIRTHVQVVHPVLDQEYGMEEIEVFSQSHSYLSICIFSLSYSSSYFKYNIYENGMEEIEVFSQLSLYSSICNMHIRYCTRQCAYSLLYSSICILVIVLVNMHIRYCTRQYAYSLSFSSICIFVVILVIIFQI